VAVVIEESTQVNVNLVGPDFDCERLHGADGREALVTASGTFEAGSVIDAYQILTLKFTVREGVFLVGAFILKSEDISVDVS
jgi:hypothetical protein